MCNFSAHAHSEHFAGSMLVSPRLASTSEGCWDHTPCVGVPVTVLKVTGSKTVQGVSFNHEFLASAYSRLRGLCFLNNQSGRLVVA
jgi:hypothetical protein